MAVGWLTLAVLGLLVPGGRAWAVEYRLLVANLWETGFVSLLKPGELDDGATGPGLEALAATLDAGTLPAGAALPDRHLQPVREAVSRAWGAARAIPQELTIGGTGKVLWDEVRWDGKPGEHSVWVVRPTGKRPQKVSRVAIQGPGPMRQYVPYTLPAGIFRIPAVQYQLDFLWFYEERGTVWERYVSRGLDLGNGIGVVVGVNFNAAFPDTAYLVVRHAPAPTTYRAILGWRDRPSQLEAPQSPSQIQ